MINAKLIVAFALEVDVGGTSEDGKIGTKSSELFHGLNVHATIESRPVHTESETDNNFVLTVCAFVRCAEFGLDCD